MRDPITLLALADALSPEDRAAVEAALADRPALAEAFARWRSLRAEVRADLAEALPDRALLVLYALADDDLLSDAERARLDAERPALEAALARHPGLQAAARRVQADREAFDRAWAEAAAEPVPEPAAPAAPRAPARPAPAADRAVAQRTRPTRWVTRALVLTAVVAFGAVLTMLFLRDAGWETVAGGQTVLFADGSTAELAEGARLMVPEDGAEDARQARLLGGQALFRVVRNPAEPFGVTTPNAEVTVLGTTFAVEATNVETEVVLVTGAVALAPAEQPDLAVRLRPGERASVLALDAPSAPRRADLDAALAWTGTVFAQGETAGVVADRLARAFDTPVAVAPALAGEPVAGEFGGDGLRDALDKLALALGGRVEAAGDGFRVVE
jgi:ferric-dicitrate binding protein FerR (iron transport regulator)